MKGDALAASRQADVFAVIGCDGTIGRSLKCALEQGGKTVYGTSRRGENFAKNVLKFDLGEESSWHSFPFVDVAFFCAAVTGFAECRADPTLARKINVEAPGRLAEMLVSRGSRVVLLSTSAVFDWSRPNVPEDFPPCPTSVYGTLKAEAETHFRQLGASASIVRLAKILHPEIALFRAWLDALTAGREVFAFSDLYMAPVSLEQTVQALIRVGSTGTGTYQLSATRDISYFQVARHLALRLERDVALVKEAKAIASGIPAHEITRFSSLQSSRIEKLTGRAPPDPFAAVDETFFLQIASQRSACR